MSAKLPIINEWQKQNYEWKHIWYPLFKPFTIPANGQVQLPSDKFAYRFKEGILMYYTAAFDHQSCGVQMKWGPELDTGTAFVVGFIGSGLTRPEELVYAIVPPYSPPGYYAIRIASAWKWEETLELYVINTDSVAHTCLAVGYMLAVTNKKTKVVPLGQKS